ncbi:MAG TPA: hypothetical protein VHQ90_15315 [Thermoanaerobaculia bacterium]|nr:hypothetical protein [Thermoanaerobaculia bacterium]
MGEGAAREVAVQERAAGEQAGNRDRREPGLSRTPPRGPGRAERHRDGHQGPWQGKDEIAGEDDDRLMAQRREHEDARDLAGHRPKGESAEPTVAAHQDREAREENQGDRGRRPAAAHSRHPGADLRRLASRDLELDMLAAEHRQQCAIGRRQQGRQGGKSGRGENNEACRPAVTCRRERQRGDQQRAQGQRRDAQVEPDRHHGKGDIDRRPRDAAPAVPVLEGRHGGAPEEGRRSVGAGDAAIEHEARRERHQPAKRHGGPWAQPSPGPHRREQQQREAGDQHRQPHDPLGETDAAVEEQAVDDGQGDAVVRLLVHEEDPRDGPIERREEGVVLVAGYHLRPQVPQPQSRSGRQCAEQQHRAHDGDAGVAAEYLQESCLKPGSGGFLSPYSTRAGPACLAPAAPLA